MMREDVRDLASSEGQWRRCMDLAYSFTAEREARVREMARVAVSTPTTFELGTLFPVQSRSAMAIYAKPGKPGPTPYDQLLIRLVPLLQGRPEALPDRGRDHPREARRVGVLMPQGQITFDEFGVGLHGTLSHDSKDLDLYSNGLAAVLVARETAELLDEADDVQLRLQVHRALVDRRAWPSRQALIVTIIALLVLSVALTIVALN